jgi:hypothetical protein
MFTIAGAIILATMWSNWRWRTQSAARRNALIGATIYSPRVSR